MLIVRNKFTNGWFGVFFLAAALSALPAQASDTGLTGHWARDDGGTRMVIAPCGGAYCATNDWVRDPGGKERVGDRLVLQLKPVSNSVFQGQAYDVRRRTSYRMTITLQGRTMRTTGCILLGLVCRNAGWTRMN